MAGSSIALFALFGDPGAFSLILPGFDGPGNAVTAIPVRFRWGGSAGRVIRFRLAPSLPFGGSCYVRPSRSTSK